jgi:hypothetical protein
MLTKTLTKKKAGPMPPATPLSIRFTKDERLMVRCLRVQARAQKRSLSEQMKYLAHLGMVARDNPDLPMSFIEGVLEGLEERRAGLTVPYPWGVLK